MDAIRLLTAPVDATSQEGQQSSTAIVPVSRQPYSSQALTRTGTDSAYGQDQDRYVWTVSVEDNGTFNFYAVPRSSYASTGQNDSSSRSWQEMWTGWSASASGISTSETRYATAQYAMYASAGNQYTGQALNLYA